MVFPAEIRILPSQYSTKKISAALFLLTATLPQCEIEPHVQFLDTVFTTPRNLLADPRVGNP